MSSRPGVIVTGAASGIGRQIAELAADRGYLVGVLDSNCKEANRVAELIGPHATQLCADITDEAELSAVVRRFAATLPPHANLNLVCNAGVVSFGPLLDQDTTSFEKVVRVNLLGTFLAAKAAVQLAIDEARGCSIVTITSINGRAPGPNAGAYGATKAAISLLTKQMALEWAPYGVRCNSVAPGLVDAGMSEPIYADDTIRHARSSAVPSGRLGTAQDIANAVLFLLSDEAAYINAAELVVDGGVLESVISTLPRPRSVDSVGPEGR